MEINDDLLQLFIVEKAAYEICYELENRPAWVDVPLRGLLETLHEEPAAHGPAADGAPDHDGREHGRAA